MEFKIPLFKLNFGVEEEKAVVETLRSKWISTGPKTAEFERRFAAMLGVPHAVALTNCSVALHLAMRIMDIKDGDEVICPSLTFVATVNAIRYVNATPVFCDIKSYDDLTLDTDMMEKLISPKTKAIIVMHYAGFPCDMASVIRIARKYELKIVEDACHGPLSVWGDMKLGTIGDIGCFSFFSNKNISTGEGGMLITRTSEYFEKARLLRSHGMSSLSYDRAKGHSTSYDVLDLGYNYRMDDIRASIGIVQLERVFADIEQRARIRRIYTERLASIGGIIIPFTYHKGFYSNYIFPIVLRDSTKEKRERVRSALYAKGIQTSVHYPAIHRFSIYRSYKAKLDKTEYVADNVITLPMYAALTEEEIVYISSCLAMEISR